MKAAEIVKKLGGRMRGNFTGTACCPAHNDRSPSLSVTDGPDGKVLAKCFAGCTQEAVIDALIRLGAWPARAMETSDLTEAERERHREQQREKEAERERERARRDAFIERTWERTWRDRLPADSLPIKTWLRVRGISSERLDFERLPLGWAPRCPLGKETAPAMVALMTDAITNKATGVHRTFLQEDGTAKAFGKDSRKMLGRAGIIRLSPDDEVEMGLGICEGIESGLSILAAGWAPIWAAGSLDALRLFPVLSGIECLTIFADPKPHEVAGARACADRWIEADREAVVRIPKNGDWNDALQEAT